MTGLFGDGIPIPDVIDPPESMEMTLCIPKNRDHMSAFFGALYQLTIWNSWQRDDTEHGKELAAVWWRYYLSWNRTMSDIDCEDGMSTCCTEPAIIKRVNPTTGIIEQSTDGGATWKPAAGGIPSVIVQPVPPVTSGVAATKCDAATNVAGQVDVWIDQVSNDFVTATTLVEFGTAVLIAILAAVFAALSLGALTPIEALVLPTIGAGLAAAWGAGKAVFDAYWSTDIKDAILCAAYCNIGADGSYTDAQFSAFWQKCNNDLPASPAKMLFMGFLSSVGKEGLNAMAASGMSADADCSDCDCADCSERLYWPTHPELLEYVEGCTWRFESVFESGHYAVYGWANNPTDTFDPNACAKVTSWAINEGSDVDQSWNECVTGTIHLHSNPTGNCFSQLYFTAPAPFKVDVAIEPC
jgi:hypothetical protein